MQSVPQFIPRNPISSNGYLMIPGHQGEFPACKLERWNWGSSSSERNISFQVGKSILSVSTQDLLDKLKLNQQQIDVIRGEESLSKRTVILRNYIAFKNAVEKQERGSRLLSFFSSNTKELRAEDPQRFLEQIQNFLDEGPISLTYLVKSFKALLEEEFAENFFILGHKILEKISLEEDKNAVKNSLDAVLESLDRLSSENTVIDEEHIAQIGHKARELRDAVLFSIAHTAAADDTATDRIRLRWLATPEQVSLYLGLQDWETQGDHTEGCKRIIECFKSQSPFLDLSDLGLTSLPIGLKKLSWIKELNVSKNRIQDLTPISHLKKLRALDLSFNLIGGRAGIQDFHALDRLEQLQSVKLLYMRGNPRLLEDLLRTNLRDCDRIEWTDDFATNRVFSRRPGELLGHFWQRRERAFRSLPVEPPQMELSFAQDIPIIDNPRDPAVLAAHPLALQRLGLTELDITPLTAKDPNIVSWLNRLVIEEGFKAIAKDADTLSVLQQKVPEILQCALDHPEFFEKTLKYLVFSSSIACGDRTVYYFNEIVRRMELFKARELPIEQALAVFSKYFPVYLIKQVSRQSVEERAADLPLEERRELEKEELEVELDFLIRFKEEFTVPLPLSKGTYVGTGRETREDFLDEAKEKIHHALRSQEKWIGYLASDPDWQSYLFLHSPSMKEHMQALIEDRDRKAEDIVDDTDSLSSAEYQQKFLDLERDFKTRSVEAFALETQRLLQLESQVSMRK